MLDSHRTIVRGAGSIILASVLFVSGATTPAWAEDASAQAGKDIAASVDSVAPLLEPSRSVGSDQVAEVTFPADPTHGLTVRLPHNVGGGTTSIRLPKQMSDARQILFRWCRHRLTPCIQSSQTPRWSGMRVDGARSSPGQRRVTCAWVSYAVFQATLAERDNPKTCLFAVVVPAIGSIWRVRC